MRSRRLARIAATGLWAALLCGGALAAASDAASEPRSVVELRRALDTITSDLDALSGELTAGNLAADPAVRAAAVAKASGTLSRLAGECRQAERLFSQLQGALPPKVGSAAPLASSELSQIVGDLSAAEQNLNEMQTLVASLQ